MNKERETMRNACYRCRWRRDVAYSAHSACAHPQARVSGPRVFRYLMRGGDMRDSEAWAALGIRCDEHGYREGWFAWPFNFDPVWLEHCDGFEPKEDDVQSCEARPEEEPREARPDH